MPHLRMLTRIAVPVFTVLSLTASSQLASAPAGPPKYSVTDVGTLRTDHSGNSAAAGINDSGAVVGVSDRDSGLRGAFLWRSDSGLLDLTTNGVPYPAGSSAYAISNENSGHLNALAGEITTTANPVSYQHAFLLFPGVQDLNGLGPFTGGLYSSARAVNSSGDAVGWAQDIQAVPHAFRYLHGTSSMTKLVTPGEVQSIANGISEAGVVVGSAVISDGRTAGRVWNVAGNNISVFVNSGKVTELYAVNKNGIAIGAGGVPAPVVPFTFDSAHRTFKFLPRLSGLPMAYPFGINADNLVVGYCGKRAEASKRAVLWYKGKVYDLNTRIPSHSGWKLRTAVGINSGGTIVGIGVHDGNVRGFVLTPR